MRVLLSIGIQHRSDGGGSVILVMEGDPGRTQLFCPLPSVVHGPDLICRRMNLLFSFSLISDPPVKGSRCTWRTAKERNGQTGPPPSFLTFFSFSSSVWLISSQHLFFSFLRLFPTRCTLLDVLPEPTFSLSPHNKPGVYRQNTRQKGMNEWIKSWFSQSEKWSFSPFFSFPVASPPVALWLGLACSCSNQDTKPHFTKNQCSFAKQTHLITG